MGIKQDWDRDFDAARAALDWQVELGATEAICDAPVNCYDLPDRLPKAAPPAKPASAPPPPAAPPVADTADAVAQARALAEAAPDLDALRAAIAGFDGCELKLGARNLVFADGQREARVMIVGEAPGREEDRQGKPFVGEAGQLLDRMLDAIGMGREHPDPARAVYITNILPWRPPQNRDPSAQERAMFRPFVLRHIELVNPDLLVLMGRVSATTMLETAQGITSLRGNWCRFMDRPCLPMLHPAYLLRTPSAKREAWADLLSLQAKLRTLT
ncbi:MAG: uracil-DNA glycosylase [Rhodobacteraceae bacterium]|nr:uracil-DNA glycosylase [Paracoccaceae bacterium]